MANGVIALSRKILKALHPVALWVIAAAALSWAMVFSQPAQAQELPSLNIDRNNITVSGLSSGAFMAVQMHTAFSERIQGVGVVAGGPFYCAESSSTRALTTCMHPLAVASPVAVPGLVPPPDGRRLAAIAQQFANDGQIDPISNLRDDNVYLFSGALDYTVYTPVMDATKAFYRALGVPGNRIKYTKGILAGHGFITPDWGNLCGLSQAPFINDCDYDQAGTLLKHLLGRLNPPSQTLSGQLVKFDQSRFLKHLNAQGMANKGYVYIPQACATGEPCRLHIALHGCKQSYETVGDSYYAHTGYNPWADSNHLVVLYPQAHPLPLRNPNGCWDWWGYTNPQYALKTGIQSSSIMKMVDQLVAG